MRPRQNAEQIDLATRVAVSHIRIAILCGNDLLICSKVGYGSHSLPSSP